MINRVNIKNFKAIREATIDLTPIHLLIGMNDTGKTSVLEAIAAICRSVDHDCENSFLGRWQGRELIHSSATDPTCEISVEVHSDSESLESQNLSYRIQAEFPSAARQALWKSVKATKGSDPFDMRVNASHTVTSYAGANVHTQADMSSKPQWPFAQTLAKLLGGCWYLRWSARNLALPTALNPNRRFRLEGNGFGLPTLIDDLLNDDRDRFAELEREFTQIFSHVRSIALVQQQGFDSPVDQADDTLSLQRSPGKQVVFRLHDSAYDLPASQAAEGMLYILGYLALMHLPEPPRVLLIEEPENGIHPLRVAEIVRILRQLIERHPTTQVILSSHSPYLVDAFEPEEVTWCRRDPTTNHVTLTRLDSLPDVERSLRVFSLGEIWTGELETPPETAEAK